MGARFSGSFPNLPGAHPASFAMSTGTFLEVNRQGRGVDQPLPSSAEFKERVVLHLYFSSWLSSLVLR